MGGRNGEMEPADGGEEQCDRRLVLVTPSPKPAVLKPEALRVCGKRNESESSSPGRDRPVSKISIRNARIRASTTAAGGSRIGRTQAHERAGGASGSAGGTVRCGQTLMVGERHLVGGFQHCRDDRPILGVGVPVRRKPIRRAHELGGREATRREAMRRLRRPAAVW